MDSKPLGGAPSIGEITIIMWKGTAILRNKYRYVVSGENVIGSI